MFRAIPPGCVHMFASAAIAQLFGIAAKDKDESRRALKIFFALCKMVLSRPGGRGGRKRRHFNKRLIQSRLRMLKQGQLDLLWSKVAEQVEKAAGKKKKPRRQRTKCEQEVINAVRCIQYIRDGDLSRAAAALTSHGMAEITPDVLQKLIDKHPEQPEPVVEQSIFDQCEPVTIEEPMMLKVLMNFLRNSGAGPAQFRPYYARQCARSSVGNRFAAAFTAAGNAFVKSSVPSDVGKWFAAARLYALVKSGKLDKNGKPDVRPIACGGVLRRGIGRAVMRANAQRWRPVLEKPNKATGNAVQLGIAVSGTEKCIHAVRTMMQLHKQDKDFGVLNIDIRNAFNECSRESLLRATAMYTPGIYRLHLLEYAEHSTLYLQARG